MNANHAIYYTSALKRFIKYTPRNPYCSDNLHRYGIFIQPKRKALGYP